ncbi:MAG TPA: IS21 family transposase [Streptosporangiaceae bacterium]|jgi:transposase
MAGVTEILQHWYAGRPKVEVARSLGVDAKTVRRYVAAAEAAGMAPGGPPVSEEQWRALARQWFPQIAGTGVRQVSWREIAVHHDRIAGLLGVVPVSVICQRLAGGQGLEASVASVRRYVRAHFPAGARPQEVRMARPPVPPGAEAQVDYGYMGLWPDPSTGRRRRLWAFSMVLPYSRHLFIRPVVSMTQRAWTEAHVAASGFFGGVPAKLTPDNLKAGVCKPDLYDPKINRGYAGLARHYGCLAGPARACHPRDKAVIEAHQRYIRSSFFAGRSWGSLAAMTADAEAWCVQVAGQRRPRPLEGRTVAEVFAAEEAPALLPLPEVRSGPATWSRPKVAPDAHVVVGRTLYSVPYRLTGKRLDARATATAVESCLDGELVKTRVRRPRGRRTDWADLPGHKTGFFIRTPAWCQAQAGTAGPACATLAGELLAVNALFRLRQAQGVLRLGQRYGDARLEAARALEAGDPSYRTVKGILAAGTGHDGVRLPLPGIAVPAWLRGPGAFGQEQR